jgi:hypothetical protein
MQPPALVAAVAPRRKFTGQSATVKEMP